MRFQQKLPVVWIGLGKICFCLSSGWYHPPEPTTGAVFCFGNLRPSKFKFSSVLVNNNKSINTGTLEQAPSIPEGRCTPFDGHTSDLVFASQCDLSASHRALYPTSAQNTFVIYFEAIRNQRPLVAYVSTLTKMCQPCCHAFSQPLPNAFLQHRPIGATPFDFQTSLFLQILFNFCILYTEIVIARIY